MLIARYKVNYFVFDIEEDRLQKKYSTEIAFVHLMFYLEDGALILVVLSFKLEEII